MREIKFTNNTQLHDIKHKVRKIEELLDKGEKVRVSVKFSGREVTFPQTGIDLINTVTSLIPEVIIDRAPLLEGKNMSSILSRKQKRNGQSKDNKSNKQQAGYIK
jgi:translation initiation factor IF-3